jgi:hypothetical protein
MPRYYDYEDDRPRVGHPSPGEYHSVVKPIGQPGEPEQFYWSLYFKGEKVNGGLSDSESEAMARASQYKYDHHRALFLNRYVFDQESCRWIDRESLNI